MNGYELAYVFLDKIEEKLQQKTGWGKNEVLTLIKQTMKEAIVDVRIREHQDKSAESAGL